MHNQTFIKRDNGDWELIFADQAFLEDVSIQGSEVVLTVSVGSRSRVVTAAIGARYQVNGRESSVEPVAKLAGSPVGEIVAATDGSLHVRLGSNLLHVPPAEDREAWEIRSGTELLAVSLPGGGISIW